ncbi:hypothetical protein [Streptomyces sp. NPDC017941]|uniref:hypothetical protein n=1 Tax=unclassified Streptomyces TaxID=2593676 RepID=UPI0037B1A925
MNDLLMFLAVATALRVFFPDIAWGARRLLRAGARVGVAELLRPPEGGPTATAQAVTRDEEGR